MLSGGPGQADHGAGQDPRNHTDVSLHTGVSTSAAECVCSGVDQGRLNIGRHGLIMTIRNTLTGLGVAYSMPTFREGGAFGPSRSGAAAPPAEPVQRAIARASQQVCALLPHP